ncbi:MAG: alpha/beta hydrolase [Eubacterium sp.]|nr:alpha/beta hydrolase [Eubacterium sp.]
MEVRDWSYEEFPEYTDIPAGADRLEVTGDEPGTFYVPDVEYAVMDGIPLHLQILLPLTRNNPEKKYPGIVYVQGSGWMEQDCYHNVGRIANLAERGYVVAIVQYRHSGQAGFPAQIQDARNAVRFVRKNAEKLRVIPDEIFLAGSSSGGHTAVMAAIPGAEDCTETGFPVPGSVTKTGSLHKEADRVFFDRNVYPGVSAGVLGVLDYYGCVSLMMPDGFPTMTDRGEPGSMDTMFLSHIAADEREGLETRASAVTYLTPDQELPPFFILHGTKDRIVNTRQSVELYEKLCACGKQAELHLLGGADHGGPEYWIPEVCDLADAFCKRILCEHRQKQKRND